MKDIEEIEKQVEKTEDNNDAAVTLFLLEAEACYRPKIESLIRAYKRLDQVIVDMCVNETLGGAFWVGDILNYVDEAINKIQVLDEKLKLKVEKLKKETNKRGLLDPPKFGSYPFPEAHWENIAAAAKEAQGIDDPENDESEKENALKSTSSQAEKKCDNCTYTTLATTELIQHISNCHRPACSTCNLTFDTKAKLETHQTNGHCYQCKECDEKFIRKSEL